MNGHGAALAPGSSTARIAPRSAAVVLLIVAAVSGLARPAVSMTAGVEVLDFGYSPDEMAITAGDEVVWTNSGRVTHTVTVDDGSAGAFDSGPIVNGASFSHVFDKAGTFVYHCRIYPSMTAVVKVAPGAAMTMTPQAQQTTTQSPETTTTSKPTTTSTTRKLTSTTPSTASPSAPSLAPSEAAPPQPVTTTTAMRPATPATTPPIPSTTASPTLAPARAPSSTTSSTSDPVAQTAADPLGAMGTDPAPDEELDAAAGEPSSDAGLPRPSRDGRMAAAGAVLLVAGGLGSVRLRRVQSR